MKRYYDITIDFAIDTHSETIKKSFSSDWRYGEMLEYMCKQFSIDKDSIVEIRHTYVKRYKLSKDD